ncbi:MAG: amino acid ABC transporter substrate-binding protein, partial [Candidatus Dadabacteria bacterium]
MKLLIIASFLLAVFPATSTVAQNIEDNNIRIAGVFSLTGFGAVGGKAEVNGISLAVNEINAAGGIKGRKIELTIEDNGSDLKNTATALKRIIATKHPVVLLGPNWAEFSEIAAPIAESHKIVMITASGYKKNLVTGKKYVFTMLPPHKEAVRPLAEYVAGLNQKKIALLVSTNAFYRSLADGFKELMQRAGRPVWKEIELNPQDLDFRTLLIKLKSQHVDRIVVFLLEGAPTYTFLKQSKEVGMYDRLIFGPSLRYDQVVLKNPNIAEGLVTVDYFSFDESEAGELTEAAKNFAASYEKHFAIKPIYASAKAYDSVYMVKRAIEECGLTSDEIRRCLLNMRYKG